MGTTVTATELQYILSDYTIHLTGHEIEVSSPSSLPLSPPNPPNWPTDRHRIPRYRPTNRTLDPEERPRGSTPAERVFLNIMFTGVFLNASVAKLWGKTGGPYFPELFKYAIGGEW